MRTAQKFNSPEPKETKKKSLPKVIFSIIWGQRKWLGWLAIILFTFLALDLFCLPPSKDVSDKPSLFLAQESPQILVQTDLTDLAQSVSETGSMGGPDPLTLGTLVGSMAQASIDFSADDNLEDQDLLLMQDNSIISNDNPAGIAGFGGFSHEVQTYIVKSGDVPGEIAASFNINSDTLLWANGLKDGDIIKPGQELIVLPINGVRVKVAAKDTVATLAKKYNGKEIEIIAFNNLSLDGALNVGDYIIIPDGELPPPPKAAPRYTTPSNKYANSTIPAGWLIIPTAGHDWGRIHASNGVDIANACGTPIYAAAAGKVILSDGVGYNGGYGRYIEIQHPNGVVTLYAHATKLLVSGGEQVAQGQVIALMGSTGRSTGCHLHFEVRGAANPLAGKARNY